MIPRPIIKNIYKRNQDDDLYWKIVNDMEFRKQKYVNVPILLGTLGKDEEDMYYDEQWVNEQREIHKIETRDERRYSSNYTQDSIAALKDQYPETKHNNHYILGYAAVFNSIASMGRNDEVIRAGAFRNTIVRDDIRMLLNHDPNLVLGRNTSGTLYLSENDYGLMFRLWTDKDSTIGSDTLSAVKRKDITQCSFGFQVQRDYWRRDNNRPLRELVDVKLVDVSIVTYPAYSDTSAVAI